MLFDEEFIWRKNHFVYHITKKENIEGIIKKGLVPQIGDRSKLIGDNTKGVFFFDSPSFLEFWIYELYENNTINDIELLRFNLKNRKWFSKDREIGDFYTPNIILPSRIEYYDGDYEDFCYGYSENNWQKIINYKR